MRRSLALLAVIIALQLGLAGWLLADHRRGAAEARLAPDLTVVTPSHWRPATLGRQITVMTYNLQEGFSRDDRFDLERQAAAIEAEHPDVVVVQEVSRGWLVAAGADEVLWLSQRLGMQAVFGANSDDGLWGNAILSRAPLQDAAREQYTTTQNLKRSVVAARVDTAAGPLWLFGTHLDNPVGATDVRLSQTRELIRFWNNRSPALVLGDLNADPGDPVFGLFTSAGLVDLDRQLPPGASTSSDQRLIDHILATPNLTLQSIRVPDTWASDHRPLVARVSLP
ncbi:MAG TPA: endonuclease/exonuclease/phosphatase family protein [Thermomicrobiaceae bacterium]|nr:endonuclease/exonuclease/phosphatase family protein [Thermomicrobiaceae bacterium]